MTLLTSWPSALPELLLAAAVTVLPGVLVALALGFRREEAAGAAPALSLGVLAIADVVAMALHVAWGLPLITVVTVLVAAGCWAVWLLLLRGRAAMRPVEPRLGWLWSAVCLVLAVLASGAAISRGIGSPESISQTFDGALHVNGIANVAAAHSAAPSVVGAAAAPAGNAPFYPPLFHGIAGLVVMTTGAGPVAAANVVAVVLAAVLWPLSVMFLVRTVVGPSRFALAFSMGAVCVISVFPGQLVSYGVLWPNALSYSILPGVLALGVLLLRHTRFRWVGSVPAGLALVVTAPALYYAHPGAAFAFVAVGLPLLAAAELGLLVVSWGHPRRRMRAIAVAVGTIVVLWVFWNGLYHLPSLNKVRDFNWTPRQSASQAVGEALFLTSSLSSEVGVIGVLVVVGAVWAFRYRTTRWLAFSHAILISLVVVCTSTAGPIRPTLTGFWYNDGFRVSALLPVTGIPLAALGALWTRAWLVGHLRVLAAYKPLSSSPSAARSLVRWAHPLAGVLVAVAVVALLPTTNPLTPVVTTVRYTYGAWPNPPLVTPDEAALYRKIAQWAPPGSDILGSPWTGAVYAGVLSGRHVVFPHMLTTNDAQRVLLMRSFDRFTTDPAVCRAVKNLDVRIVVDDSQKFDPVFSRGRIAQYTGLSHLATTPGLTVLGHSKTATVYRVGDCSTR